MISTSICSTSDYYSSSDIEYDDVDDDVVKAAPQHFSSIKETNLILQTLLQYQHVSSLISSTIKSQHSMRLFKLVQENHLSNEIFIRANAILHKFLLSICTNEIDESILIACLSLATKLNEHSTHSNITLFNSSSLITNENLICNKLDWDIDILTPINYVEAILLHVLNYSIKDRLRQLTYELIVLCLTGYFWVFTDSHVDVLYRNDGDPTTRCRNVSLTNMTKTNRKFGHFDCDTPRELLISTLSAAKKIDSNIDFIIWLGDATSHLAHSSDTILTVNQYFSQELRKHFRKTLVIPVLGNHDVVLKTNRSTRFIQFYNETKYNLLLNDDDALRTFLKGGYYSLNFRPLKNKPQTVLRFIALNTAMFQPQYMDYFDSNEPNEQIEWFNKTMFEAHNLNNRILLLAHVPFGINENLLYKFYHIKYEQKLLSIINQYSSNIIMCLSAHRHQDLFRVYSSLNITMGIIGHPSISPIGYLSQPSIRKYSYDRKSLILTDYEQYSLNLHAAERTQKDQWTFSYRFSSWYHQSKELTSKNLLQLIYLIRTNSFYLKRFLLTKHYTEKIVLTNHRIVQTLCALTLFNFDEFMSCTRVLEKKGVQYDNIAFNNSLESKSHTDETKKFWHEKMKHLFHLYDVDRDGSITPIDFEILADKLSTLVGQDDGKRREDYANARKTLCQEIMRADANLDGKVTLEEWLNFHENLANELRKPDTNPEVLEQISQRINTAFNMLDLNHDGYIAIDEWIKTCEFFGVDEKTAEKSFHQITEQDKLEEDRAKQLFFEYLKTDDPNHISNCCLCFL
ncbi:unnamed protein product [Rotaria sp. Silwood1]|nr:unnamed protein product [Rotaria sp. Silwood1]